MSPPTPPTRLHQNDNHESSEYLTPDTPGDEAGYASVFVWEYELNFMPPAHRAREFRPGLGRKVLAWVGRLSRDQVSEACPRLQLVQAITDAAARVVPREAYPSAWTYGTAVHKLIEQTVNDLHDPELRAEVSGLKSGEAGKWDPGAKRIDVLERASQGTICIYDVKTGSIGLTGKRMAELAWTANFVCPDSARLIVIETRPSR